ncbi:MAG: thiamine-phosphate kinase [Kiloniellales bacterium]
MRGEFELIAQVFARLARAEAGAFGLTDDAAVIDLEKNQSLVATVDAMIEGVHFLPDDPPGLVARKLLRVNLSDLAAMGAVPRGYLLTTAYSKRIDEAWVEAFARGLEQDQEIFRIGLLGGDSVSTPGPLALTLTALGALPRGSALRRATARAGEDVYVSGTLGDGALGLLAIKGELSGLEGAERATLAGRYRLPEPRVALGVALREAGLASSAIDISDGLIGDLGHICETSGGLGAEIEAKALPLSAAADRALEANPRLLEAIAAGGDDYELLFTAAPELAREIATLSLELGLPLIRVGQLTASGGIRLLDRKGEAIPLENVGWRHF